MIRKFNGGRGAILCDKCGCIVIEGYDMHDFIHKYLPNENALVFCSEECKDEFIKNDVFIIKK